MRATERAERVDRDLVEQAQRGDREAFAVLARTRADMLFGIARRILRDVDLAEDAVQQALVIAWRELPRLRDPDRFDAWLQRTLVHACYAEARRKRAPGPRTFGSCRSTDRPARMASHRLSIATRSKAASGGCQRYTRVVALRRCVDRAA